MKHCKSESVYKYPKKSSKYNKSIITCAKHRLTDMVKIKSNKSRLYYIPANSITYTVCENNIYDMYSNLYKLIRNYINLNDKEYSEYTVKNIGIIHKIIDFISTKFIEHSVKTGIIPAYTESIDLDDLVDNYDMDDRINCLGLSLAKLICINIYSNRYCHVKVGGEIDDCNVYMIIDITN
jgi:hypothetical protein